MHDLGIVSLCHVGLAVRSIAEFRATWGTLLGIEKWLVQELEQPDGLLQLHGDLLAGSRSTVAMARLGDIAIELVEPHQGRTRTSQWLDEHGPGIHHLAFWVEDLGQSIAALGDRAEVTYSHAARRPGLTPPWGAVVRGSGAPPVASPPGGPGFWAYVEERNARVPWCLELLDAGSAGTVRAVFGDHLVYPDPLCEDQR